MDSVIRHSIMIIVLLDMVGTVDMVVTVDMVDITIMDIMTGILMEMEDRIIMDHFTMIIINIVQLAIHHTVV